LSTSFDSDHSGDSAGFSVSWEDPGDAALTWSHERMHYPAPVSPMEFALIGGAFEAAFAAMADDYELPLIARVRRIHTYYYQTISPAPLPPEVFAERYQRALQNLSAVAARLGDVWRTQHLPEVQQHLRAWADFDLAGATDAALAAHWDDSVVWLRRVWALHIWVSPPMLFAMSQFADLVQTLYPDADPFRAYRLLQGLDNQTLRTSRALWQLSRRALAAPRTRATLLESAMHEIPAALSAFAEGRTFLGELDAYLQEYGRRGDRWDLAEPSWIEDPTPALKMLRDYVLQPERDLEMEMAPVAAEREQLVAEARAALQAQPQPVAEQFDVWLNAAQAGVVIMEDHAFYIDYCVRYELRRVLLELGRRLVAAGALEQPDDVFYLTVDELGTFIARSLGASTPKEGAQDSTRQLIAARRAEMDHFGQISPPPILGAPPVQGDDPISRTVTRFWGGTPPPSTAPILRGHPGSSGVARGPARVLRSLAEVGKLRPGDILVTETTAPPWTPLFVSVAAVVTDTGGILSHCATVAREFRIPAVVGTGQATALIRDGQLLEVDGGAGIVRILEP
jgi:pyruvate,water dikinase